MTEKEQKQADVEEKTTPAQETQEVQTTVENNEEESSPTSTESKEEKKTEDSNDDSEIDATQTKLVPADMYLKTGIHVGTKFKTKHMSKFIYKTRPDGLSVLDVEQIDERIRLAISLLQQYEPEDILVVCRRENGWKPVKLLESLTGMKVFAGRYPPGILTNSNLEDFIEAKVMIVVDAWADRNAVLDAIKKGITIIALCDTNNQCNNVDLVVPCNNKGRKSLGLFFYLVAREYMLSKGLIQKEDDMQYKTNDFLED